MLGGGCFWGVQNYLQKKFPGIVTKVGYAGGSVVNPSYKQVCTGTTGHAEVVQVQYDEATVSTEALLRHFFRIHNPTTLNFQGNDRGTQYRSCIIPSTPEQKKTAEEVIAALAKDAAHTKVFPSPIVTTIEDDCTFYEAEEYHQDYLTANPGGYCNHRVYY
jgi:methionine-S-sulfoxide reductase